jgi:type IV secretory pathway TrbD component
MVSGYRMASKFFPKAMPDWSEHGGQVPKWRFQALDPMLSNAMVDDGLLKQLEVGSQLAFKVWRLVLPLKILAGLIAVTILFMLAAWCRCSWGIVIYRVTIGGLALFLITVVANRLFGSWFMKLVRYRKTLKDVVLGLLMISIGWFLALLHLYIFDRWFLRQGR